MSTILDLIFDHFDELKPLDFVLIGVFTALFAFAAYRFFDRIYDRVLEAKDATIDAYERLTKTYEHEREVVAEQNSKLETAVNQLKARLAAVEREHTAAVAAGRTTEAELRTLTADFIAAAIVIRRLIQVSALLEIIANTFMMVAMYESARSFLALEHS